MLITSVATIQGYASAAGQARSVSDSDSAAYYEQEPLPTQIAYSPTRLSYDAEVRRVFLQYRNAETGEVERELPSRAALKLYSQPDAEPEARGRQVDTADGTRDLLGKSDAPKELRPKVIQLDGPSDSGGQGAQTERGGTTDQLV